MNRNMSSCQRHVPPSFANAAVKYLFKIFGKVNVVRGHGVHQKIKAVDPGLITCKKGDFRQVRWNQTCSAQHVQHN
ncbi:hypothetical protein M0813_01881 [Anaeramoeba flamelloides]|uniref:Uncharacterized protein n=1 Tax=Anaeramoeba flamelloides TaxID=1746091 RepID=A0ABQ8YXQ8_9EUKA|nr:hypothetical protein M0813_01881 [Anaeramoeba flamelloides]